MKKFKWRKKVRWNQKIQTDEINEGKKKKDAKCEGKFECGKRRLLNETPPKKIEQWGKKWNTGIKKNKKDSNPREKESEREGKMR